MDYSEEDRRWFMEAMQAQSVDVIKRMKEITLVMKTPEQVLEAQGVTSAHIEGSVNPHQCWFHKMLILLLHSVLNLGTFVRYVG